MISAEYRAMNREMHASRADYGTSGAAHAPNVVALCQVLQTSDVLDYGCGKGTLGDALQFPIKEYDPAIPGKGEREPADIVVCTDVLEHVEPAYLDDVIADICDLAGAGVFIAVSTRPASKRLPDGRNAHLIIESAHWWISKLMASMPLTQCMVTSDLVLYISVLGRGQSDGCH